MADAPSVPVVPSQPPRHEALARWAGPLVVLVAAVAMLAWTWGTWADVIVDFGMQLYMPWQITEGRILYKDLAHFKGPLSPYLNACWFRLFGTSITTLSLCNLGILAALLAMLYRLLLQISSRLAATIGCLTVVLVCAFGNLLKVGNYNFICPYSHEVTHGIALGIGSLFLLWVYLRRRGLAWLAGSGSLLGLAFLTDAHIFLSAAASVVLPLCMAIWVHRSWLRPCIAFAVGLLVPPLVALWMLSAVMPLHEALVGMAGSWPYSFRADVLAMPMYREGMGFDDVRGNLLTIADWSGRYALAVGAAIGLGFLLRKWTGYWWLIAAPIFVAAAWPLSALAGSLNHVARPLPLVMGVLIVVTLIRFVRIRRSRPDEAPRLIIQTGLVVLAMCLLWKMLLSARIEHYGFALAMPAAVLTSVMFAAWIPAWVQRRGGSATACRAMLLGLWAGTVIWFLDGTAARLGQKTFPIGSGDDVIWADERGVAIDEALQILTAPGGPRSLVSLPHGVMLNYLARCPNPTPYVNFTPMDLAFFPEERIVKSLQDHPPDWIVIIATDLSGYGPRTLGRDYGLDIAQWATDNYQIRTALQSPPDALDRRFRLYLLQSKASPVQETKPGTR